MTPPSEPAISQGWTTLDATGAVEEYATRLDLTRDTPSSQRARALNLAMLDLKPGEQVLEVGPGTGTFALEMAAAVGPGGQVIGVDLNSSMVDIANERASGSDLPATFRQGDVHHLNFPDGTFDACFATVVFTHVSDPVGALQEMVRVTKPGGRVVIAEADFESSVFDAPDVEVSRAVAHARVQQFQNGSIGRMLPRMFKDAGLTDVVIEVVGIIYTDMALLWARTDWAGAVTAAVRAGMITQDRADGWLAGLAKASQQGRFLATWGRYYVSGRKP